MGEHKQSEVVDGVEYRGGALKLEYRYQERPDGTVGKYGPYWYFKYVRQGIQSMYVGKCDLAEAKRRVDVKTGI